MSQKHVVEIVKWNGIENVTDKQMAEAVAGILPDLEGLPGFVSQVLYKDDDGQWVDIYVWETRETGMASNDLMAPKPSFSKLMALVDPTSISIEFLSQP